MKEDLSLTIGDSSVSLLKIVPTPPDNCTFFLFPSFILISRIDEILPPYLDGIPPLYSFRSLTASGLKTDKNPSRCEELYTGASSNRTKFWPTEPPLTLKPEAPSPTELTPGSNWIALMISFSPRKVGISVTFDISSLAVLISMLEIL